MEVHSLFAWKVFGRKFDFNPQPVIDFIHQQEKKVKTVVLSNRGGWQSPSVPGFLDFPECKEVKACVCTLIAEVNAHLHVNLGFSNSWANVNRGDNINVPHIHPGCYAAGVIYLKASEMSGSLSFFSPHTPAGYCYEPGKKHNFAPVVGDCYIFPGSLMHEVMPNPSADERISIAFNLKQV